jgi:hypothetical protein
VGFDVHLRALGLKEGELTKPWISPVKEEGVFAKVTGRKKRKRERKKGPWD